MKKLILTFVMLLFVSCTGFSQTQSEGNNEKQAVAVRPIPAKPPAVIGHDSNSNTGSESKQSVAVKPIPAQEFGSKSPVDTINSKVIKIKEVEGQGGTPNASPATEFDNKATADPNFSTFKQEESK